MEETQFSNALTLGNFFKHIQKYLNKLTKTNEIYKKSVNIRP